MERMNQNKIYFKLIIILLLFAFSCSCGTSDEPEENLVGGQSLESQEPENNMGSDQSPETNIHAEASEETYNMPVDELIETYLAPLLKYPELTFDRDFDNFITLSDSKLWDGDTEFRFASVNTPMAIYNLDAGPRDHLWTRITPFEIENQLQAVADMYGAAVRVHALSVRRPGESLIRNIYAPGQYDELMFRDIDLYLAMCRQYGLRTIFSIISPWHYLGSVADFDWLSGGDGTHESFYTRQETIEDYKQLITDLVNRVNYYTGMAYKDDKTILCWEIGNELNADHIIDMYPGGAVMPDAWGIEIAAHLKSVAPNHLVMNGGQFPPTRAILRCEDIDIITMHYYPPQSFEAFGKAYIHGEYDPTTPSLEEMGRLVEIIADNPHMSGSLAWSLRPHARGGGFLPHSDWGAHPFRWPGFNNSIENEIEKLMLIRRISAEQQGITPAELKIPEAPVLLPVLFLREIRWRGSVGARSYDLQRADTPEGPWVTVIEDAVDASPGIEFYSPFSDRTAEPERIYFYRVIAKNPSGESAPSNIVPYHPAIVSVDMEEETYGSQLIDELGGARNMYEYSGDIRFLNCYRQPLDTTAAKFYSDASITYLLPGDITDFFIT